jgi:hypothetical protein
MSHPKAPFLSNSLQYKVSQLLYDYLSFVLFLVFVLICFVIGRPFHLIDKAFNTSLVNHLIRFFEFFAR